MILIVVTFPVRPYRADEGPALADEYTHAARAEEGSLFVE